MTSACKTEDCRQDTFDNLSVFHLYVRIKSVIRRYPAFPSRFLNKLTAMNGDGCLLVKGCWRAEGKHRKSGNVREWELEKNEVSGRKSYFLREALIIHILEK